MITETQRAQQLAEAPQASEQFKDTMNVINHASLPYEAKEIIGLNYAVLYPLWPYNHRLIIEGLERVNPAYANMEKYVFTQSGLTFYANRQYAEHENEAAHIRQEIWINVKTGIRHHLEYSVAPELGYSIALDGLVVFEGQGLAMRELYEHGQAALIAKVTATIETELA